MSRCINCGAELKETSKFCPECGTPVAAAAESAVTEAAEPEKETAAEAAVEAAQTSEEKTETEAPAEAADETAAEEVTEEKQADEAIPEVIEAEKILEDIPEIRPVEGIEISHEPDESDETEIIPKPEKTIEKKPSEEFPEPIKVTTDALPASETPKKKGKGGIIAVIIIVLLIAAAAGLYFTGMLDTLLSTNSSVISETEETVTEISVAETAESAEIIETAEETTSETVYDTTTVSETTVITEEITETEETVPETESETTETVSELPAEIVLEFEHQVAMGHNVSASVPASGDAFETTSLTRWALFVVAYTTEHPLGQGSKPVVMVVNAGENSFEIAPSTISEELVVFEYDKVLEALDEIGASPADITDYSFRSDGAPVDVIGITINT